MVTVNFPSKNFRHNSTVDLQISGSCLLFNELSIHVDNVLAVIPLPSSEHLRDAVTNVESDIESNVITNNKIPAILKSGNSSTNGTILTQAQMQTIGQFHAGTTISETDTFAILALDIHQHPVVSTPKIRMFTFSSADKTCVDLMWIRDKTHKSTPKKLLAVVNPWGGTKKARSIVNTYLKPLCYLNKVNLEIIETERPLHATEIGKTFDYSAFDAVVTVSGDGLFYELINGIMSRKDWYLAVKLPIGIIPGGSGNALAKSIDVIDPLVACLNVIKCSHRPFDLFAYRHLNSSAVKYGFVELMWAFIADVDIESDHFRWAGSLRFILQAIVRIIWFRKYRGKLYYLEGTRSADDLGKSEQGPLLSWLKPGASKVEDVVSKEWNECHGIFSYFMAMNIPWCSYDTLPAPNCKISDGSMNLVWMQNVSRSQMLSFLLDTESGKYVRKPFVCNKFVKAFVLDPESLNSKIDGILDVDGEKIEYGPVVVECLPSILRLIVPESHQEDLWIPK